MTNEITVTQTRSEEFTFNVFLPHFRKLSKDHFFKITAADQVLCVVLNDKIEKSFLSIAFLEHSEPCTEFEFDVALKQTLKTLQSWN